MHVPTPNVCICVLCMHPPNILHTQLTRHIQKRNTLAGFHRWIDVNLIRKLIRYASESISRVIFAKLLYLSPCALILCNINILQRTIYVRVCECVLKTIDCNATTGKSYAIKNTWCHPAPFYYFVGVFISDSVFCLFCFLSLSKMFGIIRKMK